MKYLPAFALSVAKSGGRRRICFYGYPLPLYFAIARVEEVIY